MKTILQNTQIAYNAITIQDAITLLPLMDYLKSQAVIEETEQEYRNLSSEDKKNYKWVPSPEISKAKVFFNLLQQLGFCASNDGQIESILKDYKKE